MSYYIVKELQVATKFGCVVVIAPDANDVVAIEQEIAHLASMERYMPTAGAFMKIITSKTNEKRRQRYRLQSNMVLRALSGYIH